MNDPVKCLFGGDTEHFPNGTILGQRCNKTVDSQYANDGSFKPCYYLEHIQQCADEQTHDADHLIDFSNIRFNHDRILSPASGLIS